MKRISSSNVKNNMSHNTINANIAMVPVYRETFSSENISRFKMPYDSKNLYLLNTQTSLSFIKEAILHQISSSDKFKSKM